jgi:glycosyltransferase involved in cell wall biosynthesis
MYKNKKVVVVMPAYNAEKTLEKTYKEVITQDIVDSVIIVDDGSNDNTVKIANNLRDAIIHTHAKNLGYGKNQKTCYELAIQQGADIVIMVHPDYQYTPMLIPAMVSMIGNGLYHCVIGSRILGNGAISGGMPWWKYISNRAITAFENILLGIKLSEYHTGYRAFSRELLESIDLSVNSDDFIFDNQMLAQIAYKGYFIAEVSCPTKYFEDASSINFCRSVKYGIGCIITCLIFRLNKFGVLKSRMFKDNKV